MTRKHFIKLAEVLRKLKPEQENYVNESYYIQAYQQWRYTVLDLASFCADHNDLFDSDKFYDAAGHT